MAHNQLSDANGRKMRRPFADIQEREVQMAIASTMREDYHRRNQEQVSPPAEEWRRVLVLANPIMVFDFDDHLMSVDPADLPVLELLLTSHLYGRQQADDLPL